MSVMSTKSAKPAASSPRLLSREEFSRAVLARHGGRCCVPTCSGMGQDAHHILSRDLFKAEHEFGGYYVENGANLCGHHHEDAERTDLTVEQLREWCDIASPAMPEHLALDTLYDTWGNPVLPDGTRLPGELFYTEGCQKALRAHLHLFATPRVKAPRTLHMPWSPGVSADDKVQRDLSALTAVDEVVVTLKMDGESASIYPDGHTHARSVTASPHPSRDHLRALAAVVGPDLPVGYRVVGENLRAVHSIAYDDLPAHFLVHSIWDRDRCLSWDDTLEWCELLDLTPVTTIYRGPMLDEKGFAKVFAAYADAHEGYVVRVASEFLLRDFQTHCCKWVRASHVTTDQHWMHGPMRVNGLAADAR